MADVSESDPGKIAALTQDAMEDFVDAWVDRPADSTIDWAGCPVTAATLAGVLLGEVVMHGYDVAYALGRPWPIDPGHAGLILTAYAPLFPLIVDTERARGHCAGYALDFGGGPALTIRFTDGIIGLEPPGAAPVDVTICSDPVTFLMVADGRLSQYEAIAMGGDERHWRPTRPGRRVQEPLHQPVAGAGRRPAPQRRTPGSARRAH